MHIVGIGKNESKVSFFRGKMRWRLRNWFCDCKYGCVSVGSFLIRKENEHCSELFTRGQTLELKGR